MSIRLTNNELSTTTEAREYHTHPLQERAVRDPTSILITSCDTAVLSAQQTSGYQLSSEL